MSSILTARPVLTLAAPLVLAVAAGVAGPELLPDAVARAQPPTRINRVIEALENGEAAVANTHWRFVDMEHSPFSGALVREVLAEMDEDRNEQGQMRLAPLVRIPQDGDEDFKWAIKQALDLGAMGIILPHVDRAEEAMRFVRAMRYPPFRDTPYPSPRGERGWGPGGATRLWGLDSTEYARRADVWPLNPQGELSASPDCRPTTFWRLRSANSASVSKRDLAA